MGMNQISRAFYELKFKDYIREKNGTEFEDFFSKIMKAKHQENFISCKPWGREGDRKNDGYLMSERHLFAVNGPETLNQSRMLNKINDDFNGALSHWGIYFNKWSFVHNQDALPPQIVEKIISLNEQHSGKIHINHWDPNKLKSIIFELDDTLVDEILGPIPSERDYTEIGFKDIQPVINAISRRATPTEENFMPVPENKLYINGLSDPIIELIRCGFKRATLVTRYFNMQTNITMGDEIENTLKLEYEKLKNQHLPPDDIYNGLCSFIRDEEKKDDNIYQVAVHTVLAYYFEQCTIFEGV